MGLAFPSEIRHQQLTGPRPLRLDRSVSSQDSVPETEGDTLTRRNRESNMRRGALSSATPSRREAEKERVGRPRILSLPQRPYRECEDAVLKRNHRGAPVFHGASLSSDAISDSLGFTVDGK